jgi:hypothetical protein
MTLNISKATSTEYSFILGQVPGNTGIHAVDTLRLNIFNVELPSVSLTNTEFNWQGKHVDYHTGGITFDPLNISFIIDVNFDNWKVLFNWITFITDNKTIPSQQANDYVTDANLLIYNNFGLITTTIQFKNIWLQSLGSVTFSIREGETQIESNATFHYDRFTVL